MNPKTLQFFSLLVLFFSGCYEDVNVTLKEPHIYKGKTDEHQMNGITRAEILKERFKNIQLDR